MDRKFFIIAALLGGVLVSACTAQIPVSGEPRGGEATRNAQAATLSVIGAATQAALEIEVSRLQTQVARPQQITAVGGEAATSTLVLPSATPARLPLTATPTPVLLTPTATVTTLPCNMAQFVSDVTIPDGTAVGPGTSFTKTWRLENIGSCTWTTDYSLVFVSGDPLGGPAGAMLPGNVLPGQIIDLSVDLVAPDNAGHYRGNWKLRDASGKLFGINRIGDVFYVDILVGASLNTNPLDFAASYCQAVWSSGAGELPCPGDANDSRGYIRRINKPTLENGYISDDPALLTYPQMITDGVIRGEFPAIPVQADYHFSAVIGCAYHSGDCDVNFQLDYQIGDGSIQTLATWHEVDDGEFHLVDVDLTPLAGNNVNLILTVLANGSPSQDRALWLAPHVAKR